MATMTALGRWCQVSGMLELDDGRPWTPELLSRYLSAERDHDLDWRRFEIVDGALIVSPPAIPRHELIVAQLCFALQGAVPPGFHVLGAVGAAMGRSYRVTDVTVLADWVFDGEDVIVVPADVLLAVEIESPSSITTDRVTKPAQYAAAGIEHYWRVETGTLCLHAYRLVDDVYAEAGTWHADELARITEPFVVDIDLAGLLPC